MSNSYLVDTPEAAPQEKSGGSSAGCFLVVLLIIGGLAAAWKGGLFADRSFPTDKLASLESTLLDEGMKKGKIKKKIPKKYEWGKIAVVEASQHTRSGKPEMSPHHYKLKGLKKAEHLGRTDSLVFTVLGKRRVQKGKYKSVRDGSVSSESRGLQSVVVHVFSLPDEKYVGSHEVKVGKNLPEKIEANSGLSDIKGNVSVWLNKQY